MSIYKFILESLKEAEKRGSKLDMEDWTEVANLIEEDGKNEEEEE